MTASQLWRSSDWCQMNSTGFWRTWPMAWKASWSQLDPGKTTTPNFMGTSGSDAGIFILAQRRERNAETQRARRNSWGGRKPVATVPPLRDPARPKPARKKKPGCYGRDDREEKQTQEGRASPRAVQIRRRWTLEESKRLGFYVRRVCSAVEVGQVLS